MSDSNRDPRRIPEIQEAISLFERWEETVSDPSASKRFTEAVQLLSDYLDCEPNSPHKAFIRNLQMSNTRRLLQLLSRVDKKDFATWLDYAIAAMSVLKSETESAMAADPELRKEFDSFLNVWGDAVLEALQRTK
jgi:hypothetical protein